MNNKTLKLLFLEDSMLDVELCVRELQRAGYQVEYEVVQDKDGFVEKINNENYDIVLADYNLPGFNGIEAIQEFRGQGFEKPLLIISGSIGDETAVESIKAGANDYVLKDRLVRLPSAIERALNDWKMMLRHRQAEEALRETNEVLHALIQASPLAIVVTDRDGYVKMWNDAAERIFGWSEEEAAGRFLPIVPEDRMHEYENMRDQVLKGKSLTDVEVHNVKKDGSHIDASISAAPLRDANGRVTDIMSILADISERKQAEQARREMEKQIDEAKRLFYRETILAVTEGRLEIVDPPEMELTLDSAEVDFELETPDQLSSTRRQLQEYCEQAGLKDDRLSDFILGVGEAMTNALKHGEYGHVYAGKSDCGIWVAVTDRGPGIDALILPGATLRRGFSTKPSLGIGYSVILNVADLVKLNTGPTGTTVMLQKYLKELSIKEPVLEFIPDTWQS